MSKPDIIDTLIPLALDGEDKMQHQPTVFASSIFQEEHHIVSKWNNIKHVYKLPLQYHQ